MDGGRWFIHLATQQVLLQTLKRPHDCSLRVSGVSEYGEEVRRIDTPLIWLDANLRIQEFSCALLKDKMTSLCAILLGILRAESFN